jgi:Purple acid Phosphatase, N-terminal domain/Repeat of unknown function (DUF5648)
MKTAKYLVVTVLLFFAVTALAQKPMDEASEKNVHITSAPTVTNNNGSSATLTWATDHQGANHVQYRKAGSNEQWKSAYHTGGGTQHTLQLTGLTPGQTYEYQILTRDGDVRTTGQFQAGSGGSTSTPASAGSTGAGGAEPSGANAGSDNKVTLYSASNPNGTYAYSMSATPSLPGFTSNGVVGHLLTSQKAGTLPLYRLTDSRGDTILTTDQNERTRVLNAGYKDDGVAGYVAPTNWRGTEPLYHLIDPSGQHNLYTSEANVHQQLVQQQYKDVGPVGYIWAQQ